MKRAQLQAKWQSRPATPLPKVDTQALAWLVQTVTVQIQDQYMPAVDAIAFEATSKLLRNHWTWDPSSAEDAIQLNEQLVSPEAWQHFAVWLRSPADLPELTWDQAFALLKAAHYLDCFELIDAMELQCENKLWRLHRPVRDRDFIQCINTLALDPHNPSPKLERKMYQSFLGAPSQMFTILDSDAWQDLTHAGMVSVIRYVIKNPSGIPSVPELVCILLSKWAVPGFAWTAAVDRFQCDDPDLFQYPSLSWWYYVLPTLSASQKLLIARTIKKFARLIEFSAMRTEFIATFLLYTLGFSKRWIDTIMGVMVGPSKL